jgi:hypothetical protein
MKFMFGMSPEHFKFYFEFLKIRKLLTGGGWGFAVFSGLHNLESAQVSPARETVANLPRNCLEIQNLRQTQEWSLRNSNPYLVTLAKFGQLFNIG